MFLFFLFVTIVLYCILFYKQSIYDKVLTKKKTFVVREFTYIVEVFSKYLEVFAGPIGNSSFLDCYVVNYLLHSKGQI